MRVYISLSGQRQTTRKVQNSITLAKLRTYYFILGGSPSDRVRPTDNDVTRYEGDLEPSRLVIHQPTIWMTFYADRGTTYTGFWIEITAVYPEDVTNCSTSDQILLSSEICNGVMDCPDSSDETVCSKYLCVKWLAQ